jgi:putative N6-adenine-specific DNA methylase
LFNGPLECELRKYVLFDGRLDDHRAAGGFVKTDAERRQMAEKKRFKQHREGFKRGFSDDDRDDVRDDHRFNKFSRRKEGFAKHDEDSRDRRDFRKDGDRRDFRGRDNRKDGDRRGSTAKRGDYRPKGNDRAARQEARRRFFGGHDKNED